MYLFRGVAGYNTGCQRNLAKQCQRRVGGSSTAPRNTIEPKVTHDPTKNRSQQLMIKIENGSD